MTGPVFVEKNKVETIGIFSGINVGVAMVTNVGATFSVTAGNYVNLQSNDTMGLTATNSLSLSSSGEARYNCGKAAILQHKDGTTCLSGTTLILDFDEIEINVSKQVIINSKKIKLGCK